MMKSPSFPPTLKLIWLEISPHILPFMFVRDSSPLKKCTLSVGEDGQTVDVVGVTVIDLNAFSRHHPASDAGVIATGEKLLAVQHS